jgi:hypothetical protein
MSGKYLLDTNAIIYAIDRKLKLPANRHVGTVITLSQLVS